jgi:uncharacterized surface protein with fasciclin (FAS1) repeats
MKSMYRNILKYSAMLVMAAAIVACDDDDNEVARTKTNNSVEGLFRDRLTNVDLFYDAIKQAGLEDRLTGDASYTFFAPTNDAMKVLLGENPTPEQIRAIVDAHTLEGTVLSSDIQKGFVTMVGGQKVYTSVQNGVQLNAKATVSNPNNEGTNGVVHVISYPLTDFPEQTITEIVNEQAGLAEGAQFTTLQAALVATGLDQALNNEAGTFTVFAPTDAAFAKLGLTADNVGSLPLDFLTEVLQQHVLSERFFTVDYAAGSRRIYTLNGGQNSARGLDITTKADEITIQVNVGDQSGAVSNASSVIENILAVNGTIHAINEVIFAEPYVIDFISGFYSIGSGNQALFGPFYTALSSSGNYDELLRSEAPYTLLAVRSYSDTDIENYIFEGNVDISNSVGSKITAINGASYFVTAVSGREYLNGRNPITTFNTGASVAEDVVAYNGLISLFNVFNAQGRFTPLPAETTTQVMSADANYSLFTAALNHLGLDDVANATYLYVNNTNFRAAYAAALGVSVGAIAGISNDELVTYLGSEFLDDAVLEDIVDRHIVPSVFFQVNAPSGATFTNRNGETLRIANVGGTVGIQSKTTAGVVSVIGFTAGSVDILGSNGAVHVINAMLTANVNNN